MKRGPFLPSQDQQTHARRNDEGHDRDLARCRPRLDRGLFTERHQTEGGYGQRDVGEQLLQILRATITRIVAGMTKESSARWNASVT